VGQPPLAIQPTRRRLFLADDDQRTAKKLASMLEESGYIVEVFRDGRAVIERLERAPLPDAIITDLIMPRASGIAVLGEARRRARGVPVIFVTGHPELLLAPAIPFEPSPIVFTKPISYDDLITRLDELLPANV
jgi:CheY-like chemotaxis protein